MDYTSLLHFEWDPVKSTTCWHHRGFDFRFVVAAFRDPNRLIFADMRQEYGESRFQLIGRIEERVYVVVFTPRPSALRIISARKANSREVHRYGTRTQAPDHHSPPPIETERKKDQSDVRNGRDDR